MLPWFTARSTQTHSSRAHQKVPRVHTNTQCASASKSATCTHVCMFFFAPTHNKNFVDKNGLFNPGERHAQYYPRQEYKPKKAWFERFQFCWLSHSCTDRVKFFTQYLKIRGETVGRIRKLLRWTWLWRLVAT